MVTKKSNKNSKSKVKYLRNNVLIYGIVVVAVAAILITVIPYTFKQVEGQYRLQQINSIYASLDLSDKYFSQSSDVFGEKRIYEWDSSRSYSSSKTYIKAAAVDETTNELRTKIESIGFKYLETPYPNAAYKMLIFKSNKDQYIRLTVSSKVRDDAFQNKTLMNQQISDADYAIDPNAGPSNITVKVNLNDNNE